MKITLLQTNIEWGETVTNCRRAEAMINEAEPSDLYVLPEMFATGFATSPKGIAEEEDDSSVLWMQKVARERNAAIAGSLAIKTRQGEYCNRLYFVTPDMVWQYDKHHLFTYGGENKHYTAGNNRIIAEWKGVRFLLQVCYDLRFPCFARNSMVAPDSIIADYDCAIYVANWPEPRRKVWDVLLKARAIENQCYVIGVNRVGDDPVCHYNGGTVMIDAYGRVAAAAEDHNEQSVTAILDMEKLKVFRLKFPVLRDADEL